MMFLPAAAAFAILGAVYAVDPLVDLSYSRYEGTPLPGGVSQWLGIRYAVFPLLQTYASVLTFLGSSSRETPIHGSSTSYIQCHGSESQQSKRSTHFPQSTDTISTAISVWQINKVLETNMVALDSQWTRIVCSSTFMRLRMRLQAQISQLWCSSKVEGGVVIRMEILMAVCWWQTRG